MLANQVRNVLLLYEIKMGLHVLLHAVQRPDGLIGLLHSQASLTISHTRGTAHMRPRGEQRQSAMPLQVTLRGVQFQGAMTK